MPTSGQPMSEPVVRTPEETAQDVIDALLAEYPFGKFGNLEPGTRRPTEYLRRLITQAVREAYNRGALDGMRLGREAP